MDDGLFVNVEEAAERLNVNPETIRRRIRKGVIKAQLIPGPRGDQYQIPVSELNTQEAQIVPVPQLPPSVIVQFTQAVSAANQEAINEAFRQVTTAIEAVVDTKIESLKAENQELKNQLNEMRELNYTRSVELNKKIDTIIGETRKERAERQKKWWKIWG